MTSSSSSSSWGTALRFPSAVEDGLTSSSSLSLRTMAAAIEAPEAAPDEEEAAPDEEEVAPDEEEAAEGEEAAAAGVEEETEE